MSIIANKIMNVFESYRKRISDEIFDNTVILAYLQKCIDNDQAIRLVFPTLHCKSINSKSVFNHLPDASDILAIYTIESLISEVNALYKHGIEIAIVHEGHFYGRVGIVHTDYLLDQYLTDLTENISHPSIKTYKINDFFPLCETYDQMRDEFYQSFVPSLAEVDKLLKSKAGFTNQYTNYMCFIKNEFLATLCPYTTSTAMKNWIKKIAKEQLRIYLGFAKIVSFYFKDYLRVSALYKSPEDSDKLAIELIPNNSNLATPGFHILFKNNNGEFCLKKRKDINENKVVIRYLKNGRYQYYEERPERPVLLLDFDGVLCDNSELLGYQLIGNMLKERNIDLPYQLLIQRFVGSKLPAIADTLNSEHGLTIIDDAFILEFRSKYSSYLEQHAQKVDRIDSLLTSFKDKYICTSNTKQFVQKFLARSNLIHLFNQNNIISMGAVKRPKPAPDVYLHAMKDFCKQNPGWQNFLAIEDSYDGVLAAKAAGVQEVIGFVGASSIINKVYQEGRLLDAGVSRVFRDMLNLKKYILGKYND